MKEDNYILFEKYLSNELTTEELDYFDLELSTNTYFKQEFEIYKSLNESLSSKFENEENETELRSTLTNLGKEFIKEEKKGKVISIKRLRPLMVAASIALLVGFFLFNNGNPVYSDFAKHNNLELVVRSENNSAISKAEEAFNTKNYKTAFAQLTVLESEFPNDIEIQLHKGICLLELDKYSQAETIFTNISNGTSAFKNKATWYKALTYLKQEQFENCSNTLQTIPKSADEYELAQKLLKKL
ncbi:hypothetical protein SAMN05444411_11371 [Lutibacter oricola]|uniref:Tetratricopeptide repeat-containing protein n=1 Tax=Lutibacter oricola TaxID=762486 RepID=A0A1H3G7F2_9FLAO|nr:hypothetical protein [Lutibacter oricola]SDX99252.1 hypothetical protein SAMN05444411_11371 [Lutibacter oricola]